MAWIGDTLREEAQSERLYCYTSEAILPTVKTEFQTDYSMHNSRIILEETGIALEVFDPCCLKKKKKILKNFF